MSSQFPDLESLSPNPWASSSSSTSPQPPPQTAPPLPNDTSSSTSEPTLPPQAPPLTITFSSSSASQPSTPQYSPKPNIDLSEFDPFSPVKPSSSSSTAAPVTPAKADSDLSLPPSPDPATSIMPIKRRRKRIALDGSLVAESENASGAGTVPAPSPSSSSSQPQRHQQAHDGGEQGDGSRLDALPPTPKEPVFDFQGFLGQLRAKSAEGIAKYLKSFLTNFAKKQFTVNEQIKLIHDFLEFIAAKMKLVEPWKSQSDPEFDNAMEAMEKLVMNRLYSYTFTPQIDPLHHPITTDDLERDAVLQQRIRLFGWVREKHLDVPEGEGGSAQGFLAFAEQELLKINHYKAPRDKMICILNCCKVIFGLIRHVSGNDHASADSFLPILIFVVLRANPEHLLSNVEYITRFRSGERLQGEAGYYLSSLGGAISFIETMDSNSLSNITQAEFEANISLAIASLPPPSPLSPRSPLARSANNPNSAEGEEPARALTNLPTPGNIALDNTRRFFARTGEIAQGAVSRPLSAIGRLIDGIGPGSGSDGEGEGSGDEAEGRKRRSGDEERTPVRPIGYQPRVRAPQGNRISSYLGAGSGSPGSGGAGWLARFTGDSPTPAGGGLAPGLPGVQDDGHGQGQGYGRMDFSAPPSRNPTPSNPQSDPLNLLALTAAIDQTHASARTASIETLHQMFPGLDEEVAGVVLDSQGGDLGGAIDRMLEMAAG